jgi:cell division protein FtsB
VRARRGFHLAFWIFSASVVSLIVVGIVALNAMVVNTTYRMESSQLALDDLQTQQKALTREVATLSAPSYIEAWARTQRMVEPDDVVVLPVAGVGKDR